MKNLLPLAFIVLAIASYFVYLSPEYENIKVLRAEEARYLEAKANAEELTRVYDRLATEYNNLSQANIDRLNVFLPDSFDSTRFAMDMDGLAGRYGIKIRDISVESLSQPTDPSLPQQAFKTHTVSFKFKSPYPNFVAFMKDIETNLHIMDVTKVTFAATETGIYDFTVSLQTYSLNDK